MTSNFGLIDGLNLRLCLTGVEEEHPMVKLFRWEVNEGWMEAGVSLSVVSSLVLWIHLKTRITFQWICEGGDLDV
jgi:hypothetical protein